MKRALLIIGVIVIFFVGCKKDDVLEASRVEMNGVDIKIGWDYMKMSGEYSYPLALESMKLYLSEKEDLSAAKVYECTLDDEAFSVDVKDLKDGVTYYYCYEYDNGYTQVKSEKESFKTVGKPIVVTKDVGGITKSSAVLSGSVTNNDAANKIKERGFCWGKNPNPTISGSHNNNGSSSGTGTTGFSYNLTNLTSGTKYYVRTYIVTDLGTLYGNEKSFMTTGEQPEEPEETISGTENGHNYVDLGLPSGLKWATCNVGANSPEEYGNYYAWGETTTKAEYAGDNCTTFGLSKSELQSQGYIDNNGNLIAQHDAATANWGGDWRMPTYDELEELITNCTWTWITRNGVEGYKVTSKTNGNYIFLPAAGYRLWSSLGNAGSNGYYWSSAPNDDGLAYGLFFGSSNHRMGNSNRRIGLSVRPVFGGDFEEPEEPETPSANPTFNVNGVSFTMIAVEGGTFKMGAQSSDSSGDNYDSDASSSESPVHSVTLSSYYIGETEVTQELWQAVMGTNPSYSKGNKKPVEQVSWNDCQEFITKLNNLTGKNFRLPTEAEWEYAARGGNKSKGYKYSGSNTIDNVAWYTSNSGSQTHDVKTKQANELGIYDMSGNVYEWCQDWYGSYGSGSQTNPTGPSSGSFRVDRGSSWGNHAEDCRVSYRNGGNPDGISPYLGLRLSLSQD